MNSRLWLVLILPLTVACGCSGRSVISSPPAWGSDKKHSTVEGFIVGRWRSTTDRSTARYRNSLVERLSDTLPEEIVFNPGGTFNLESYGCVAHGKWTIDARGVEVTLHDVGGADEATILRHHQAYVDSRRLRRFQYLVAPPRWEREYSTWNGAKYLHLFTLGSDQKTLVEGDQPKRADGSTFLGTVVWRRVG